MLKIKDLPESQELDREAMQQVYGGSTPPLSTSPLLSGSTRLRTFYPGWTNSAKSTLDPLRGSPPDFDYPDDFMP